MIISREENECINEGLIIKEDRGSVFKYKKKVATSKLREQAIQIAGLKRYLKEYTLIKDRQAIEVKLFEEYLVFAQMLGIAKEVAKDFECGIQLEKYNDIKEGDIIEAFIMKEIKR